LRKQIDFAISYMYVSFNDDGEEMASNIMMEKLTMANLCMLCKPMDIKGCQNFWPMIANTASQMPF